MFLLRFWGFLPLPFPCLSIFLSKFQVALPVQPLFFVILNPQGFSFSYMRCTGNMHQMAANTLFNQYSCFSKTPDCGFSRSSTCSFVVSQGFGQNLYLDFRSHPFCEAPASEFSVSQKHPKFPASLPTALNLVRYHLGLETQQVLFLDLKGVRDTVKQKATNA